MAKKREGLARHIQNEVKQDVMLGEQPLTNGLLLDAASEIIRLREELRLERALGDRLAYVLTQFPPGVLVGGDALSEANDMWDEALDRHAEARVAQSPQ